MPIDYKTQRFGFFSGASLNVPLRIKQALDVIGIQQSSPLTKLKRVWGNFWIQIVVDRNFGTCIKTTPLVMTAKGPRDTPWGPLPSQSQNEEVKGQLMLSVLFDIKTYICLKLLHDTFLNTKFDLEVPKKFKRGSRTKLQP